jgi:hypothetical protein
VQAQRLVLRVRGDRLQRTPGYGSAANVAEQYPRFFWSKVEPFIGDALGYLELTVDGRQWIANLYCNVFEMEHGRRRIGPQEERKRPLGDAAARARPKAGAEARRAV